MIGPVLKNKFPYAIILIVAAFIFSGFQTLQKITGGIVLHDEHLSITPKEFYISNITDDRKDKSEALLLSSGNIKGIQSQSIPTDLQGGTFKAVKQFIEHNLPRNTSLRPLVISLKKFKVTESAL